MGFHQNLREFAWPVQRYTMAVTLEGLLDALPDKLWKAFPSLTEWVPTIEGRHVRQLLHRNCRTPTLTGASIPEQG